MVEIGEVAAAVKRAQAEAQIPDPRDVHYVQVKGPLLTPAAVADADKRGVKVVTRDPNGSKAFARGATALGVALALGELKDADVNDSVVAQRMDLFSSVANTSAGGELRNCEILLFGNSERSGGDFRIGHAVLSDVIDAEGVRSAVRQAIGDESAPVEPERIVAIFAKAEAPPNGMLRVAAQRCYRTPTSTTSGTHAPRSALWSPRLPATPRSSCPAARSTSASRGRRR